MTATTVSSNTTATPSSLRVTDAQMHFFASKEEYQAFQAAWKTFANSGEIIPASMFAAHAILHGRDLYKTFSPNRRPHQASQPYLALAQALAGLPYVASYMRSMTRITPEQSATLLAAFAKAADFVTAQKLNFDPKYTALLTGKGEFVQPQPQRAGVEA